MSFDPRDALVTVFGLGRLKPAPGTWGSLPPPLLALGLLWSGAALWVVNTAIALLGLAFSIACVRFGAYAEARYGKKDPGQVVADSLVVASGAHGDPPHDGNAGQPVDHPGQQADEGPAEAGNRPVPVDQAQLGGQQAGSPAPPAR